VAAHGRVVDKESLLQAVWPDSFVEEANLSQNIFVLRKALGERQRYIETVPKRGYRFTGEVRESTLERSGTPAVELHSVAVLPFLDLSPQHDQEYFSDGLTEEIINALTRLGGLKVAARTSAFQFKGRALDVRQIGEQLGVRTVLEGSVRKEGTRLRITAQLNEAVNGYHLWSATYDRHMQDVFAIQEEISRAIAATLQIRLAAPSEHRLVNRYTEDLQAYHLYLRGRYFANKITQQDLERAVHCFEQALERDRRYAPAYAGLADSYGLLAANTLCPTRTALEKAWLASMAALALDDSLAEAHASLGYIRHHEWNWAGANDAFERALERNPNHSVAYHWYSHNLTALGRMEESLAVSQRALELDPLDLLINFHLGWFYFFAHRYELCLEQCQKVLAMDGHFGRAHQMIGQAYEQLGQHNQALTSFQAAVELSSENLEFLATLARALLLAGRQEEGESILVRLQNESRYVPPYSLALIWLAGGDHDRALESLEKAFVERSTHMAYARVDPRLDKLREHSGLQALLQRMGLMACPHPA
jgi:TolB-like protein/Tfp pilus assembly protein PilF